MPLQDRYDHVRSVVPNATASPDPFHAEPTILTCPITETLHIPRLTDCLPDYDHITLPDAELLAPSLRLLSCARRVHCCRPGKGKAGERQHPREGLIY